MIDLTDRDDLDCELLIDLQCAKAHERTDDGNEPTGDRNVTFKVTTAQAEQLYTEVAERYVPGHPRVGFWTRWDQMTFEIV